jgi:DinB family protein
MKTAKAQRARNTHPNASEIRAVLTLLSGTPQKIAQIAQGLSEPRLHRRPEVDAWSAQEIVAHLRACAEVWGRSIDRMLAEDHPTIRYVSPRGWITKTDYLQQNFHETLRAFSEQRATLVTALRALSSNSWTRGATFTGTTLGRAGTVLSYATRIAEHEVRHLDQLRRTVKS